MENRPPLETGTESSYILQPWKNVLPPVESYGPFYLMIAAILGGILIYRLRARYLKIENQTLLHRRIAVHCRECGLTGEELQALIAALHAANPSSPETAIRSEVYFQEFLAPALTARVGGIMRNEIRRKLFERAEEEEVQEYPTRHFTRGQRMNLQIESLFTPVNGAVIRNDEKAFVVAFPNPGEEVTIQKFDKIEGTYELEGCFMAFESEVLAVVTGQVVALRVAHTGNVRQLHKRGATRVPSGRKVLFLHVPALEFDGEEIDLDTLEARFSERYEGSLADISLGGCAILTQCRAAFSHGDLLQFSIPVKEGIEPLEFIGSIVHLSDGPDGAKRLHVAFLGLDEMARHAIGLLVARHQQQQQK